MKVGNACVGCGQCAGFCPFDAIMIFGRAAMNNKCIGCGKCVIYCPLSAISEEG